MLVSFLNLFKSIYRKYFPKNLRIIVRNSLKKIVYFLRYIKLKKAINSNQKVKLILGAALTSQKGWFSTNEQWLDISKSSDWNRIFNKKQLVTNAVAEHVFEHLTVKEMRSSLKNIYNNLSSGGVLRIAVPDGNHPDENYRKNTGINGIGADASDHKQFITYEFLKEELIKMGFNIEFMEGYYKDGSLEKKKIDDKLGHIIRTRSNIQIKNTKFKYGWEFVDSNTSMIIDAYKN